MPGKRRGGGPGQEQGDEWHDYEAEVVESAGGAYGGKVDQLVARVIPGRWLATVFVATAAAALLFFILTIVGLVRWSGAAARGKIQDLEGTVEGLRGELSEKEKALVEAAGEKRQLEGRIKTAEKKIEDLQGRLNAAAETQKTLRAQVADLQKELRAEQVKVRQADGAREAADKKSTALGQRIEKLQGQLTEMTSRYEELQKQKDERAKVDERARLAYEAIIEAVSQMDDPGPEKSIEAIERMRKTSGKDLAGTVYMERLDAQAERHRRLIEDEKRRAEKLAKREEKETYGEVMRKASMAADHDEQVAILTKAKEELAGSGYDVRLDEELKARGAAHKQEVVRNAYQEVLRKIEGNPDAHAENLQALREALPKMEVPKYEARIKREIEVQKKGVARDTYKQVMEKIRGNPKAAAENLRALKEALPKTEGTRYGVALQRLLKAWEK